MSLTVTTTPADRLGNQITTTSVSGDLTALPVDFFDRVLAQQAKDLETAAARAAALSLPAATSIHSEICWTWGRMYLSRDGQAKQATWDAKLQQGTFAELREQSFRAIGVGEKHEAECFYVSAILKDGDTHKTNAGPIWIAAMDFDEAIRSQEQFDSVLAKAEELGANFWFPTASHDPQGGKWRLRLVFLLNRVITYDQLRGVGLRFRLLFAEVLELKPEDFGAIDPVSERGLQVFLIPKYPTPERLARATCGASKTEAPVDISAWLAEIAAEESAEAEAQAAREAARANRPTYSSGSGFVGVDQGGEVDRLAGARADLAGRPVPAGCGRSNDGLAASVWKCRSWGLTAVEAAEVMIETYCPQGQGADWLRDKVTSIYARPDDGGDGAALRRANRDRAFSALSGVGALGWGETPEGKDCEHFSTDLAAYVGAATDVSFNRENSTCVAPPTPTTAEEAPRVCGIRVKRIHQRFLPEVNSFEELPSTQWVKSPCGTGKNFRFQKAIEEAERRGVRVVQVVPLQTLAWSASADTGLPCYLDEECFPSQDIYGSCVVCLDSICRIKAVDPLGTPIPTILVFDEMAQLAAHAVGGTIRKARTTPQIHAYVRGLCSFATHIIFQDANLDEVSIRHSLRWCRDRDLNDAEIVVNTARTFDPVTFVRSGPTAHPAHWRELLEVHDQGGKVYVACTTKGRAAALHREFLEARPGARALLITKDTAPAPAVQAALRTRGLLRQYDAVFASPTAKTGISITDKDTWHVFAWADAYYDPSEGYSPTAQDLYQALSRIRSPLQNYWRVCCAGATPKLEDDPAAILADFYVLNTAGDKIIDGVFNWAPKLGVTSDHLVRSIENPDLAEAKADQLAKCGRWGGVFHDRILENEDGTTTTLPGSISRLWQELQFGAPICMNDWDEQESWARDPEEDKAIEKGLQEAREQNNAANDAAIAASTHISKEQADILERRPCTPEVQHQIMSARIRDFYGLSRLTPEDVAFDRRGGRARSRAFAEVLLVQRGHVEEVKAIDARAGGCYLHRKHAWQRAELSRLILTLAGITDFSTGAVGGTEIKPTGALFVQKKSTREALRIILGIRFSSEQASDPMYLVRSLLGRMGLRMKVKSRSWSTLNGKRTCKRTYVLDKDSVAKMLERSQAYYDRVFDPSAVAAQPQPGVWTAEEMDRVLEELLAA